MPPAPSERRLARLAVLVAILAILGSVKVWFTPGTGPFGVDGAFYVNVARNVQEGVGLKTSISMYHYGQLDLPTPSPLIYPVWPLLLGYTARLVGLFQAVDLLPKVFYFVVLLLLYALTNRIAARLRCSWNPGGMVTPGHLLVLLWGTNSLFFSAGTYPYTDAPGLAVLFATLLLLDLPRDASWRVLLLRGALVGVAAGIGILTRTQLVILAIAIAVTLVWLVICERRVLPVAIAFAAVYACFAAFWYFRIYQMPSVRHVELTPFVMWSEPLDRGQWLRDRVQGLVVSLTPFSPYSYFRSLRLAFVLPLIAAAVAIVRWLRARRYCISSELLLPATTIVAGLGFFFVLVLYHHHPDFFIPWLFGFRHAMPVVLLIVVAVPFLLRMRREVRWLVVAVVLVTAAEGSSKIIEFVTTPLPRGPSPAERQAIAWMESQKPRPTVLTTRSQYLAVYSHANFHWTECRTPRAQTRAMLEQLPIDYVFVFAPDRDCEFLRGLGDLLVERAAFGEGFARVYLLGRRPAAAGSVRSAGARGH